MRNWIVFIVVLCLASLCFVSTFANDHNKFFLAKSSVVYRRHLQATRSDTSKSSSSHQSKRPKKLRRLKKEFLLAPPAPDLRRNLTNLSWSGSNANLSALEPSPVPFLPKDYRVRISEGNQPARIKMPCSVECFWSERRSIVTTYNVVDRPLHILFSMEGPQYYPQLKQKHPRTGRATTSFDTEIPVPYISNIFDMQHVEDSVWEGAMDRVSFIATNCNSKNKREEIVRAIMKLYPVDSVASCLNNVKIRIHKKGDWGKEKKQILRQYKFHLAFENQCEVDYITEKAWISLMSGTLPIYYGAPNIKSMVPTNSMIYYEDFKSNEELVAYIQFLQKNETAYNAHHKWRHSPLEDFVVEKYKHTNEHVQCRMCKWVASQELNLTWSKHLQELVYTEREQNEVPFILHQTAKHWEDTATFSLRADCERTFKNDKWSYIFWNDDDVHVFVELMFPHYFGRWNTMTPYTRKVDAARYMWMHRYGGVYLDANVECVRSMANVVRGLPQGPVVGWLGGSLEPFFLLSTPGHEFWLFVVEKILKHWTEFHAQQLSDSQRLNQWAIEWVELHGLQGVQLFEMRDSSVLDRLDDRNEHPSWKSSVPASTFEARSKSSPPFKLGFLPSQLFGSIACPGAVNKKTLGCTNHTHAKALFVHHCRDCARNTSVSQ